MNDGSEGAKFTGSVALRRNSRTSIDAGIIPQEEIQRDYFALSPPLHYTL